VSLDWLQIEAEWARDLQQVLSPQLAELMAHHLAQGMRDRFGGQRHYIPARAIDRDRVRGGFNGHNLDQLSAAYGLSTRHIRRLVR